MARYAFFVSLCAGILFTAAQWRRMPLLSPTTPCLVVVGVDYCCKHSCSFELLRICLVLLTGARTHNGQHTGILYVSCHTLVQMCVDITIYKGVSMSRNGPGYFFCFLFVFPPAGRCRAPTSSTQQFSHHHVSGKPQRRRKKNGPA